MGSLLCKNNLNQQTLETLIIEETETRLGFSNNHASNTEACFIGICGGGGYTFRSPS